MNIIGWQLSLFPFVPPAAFRAANQDVELDPWATHERYDGELNDDMERDGIDADDDE
jgi:hypothetical protein